MQHHTSSAGTLTKQSDLIWIAAKLGDVLLDPMQSQLLVEYAGIGDTFAVDLIGG